MYTKDEKKEFVHYFWTSFDQFCSEQGYLSRRRKKWILHHTKVRNVQLKFDLQKNSVVVAIEITHRDEEERLRVFEKIEACKLIVEEGFDSGLIWDFLYINETGHEVCRIYRLFENCDFQQKGQWPEIFKFMADNMYTLETNFLEIRDLITEEWH